jgi:K+-transporting ATPase ATPase A chain
MLNNSTIDAQLFGVILMYGLTLLMAIPLGKYMARLFAGERTWMDGIAGPLERLIFRISRIDPTREMDWKQHLKAMLALNIVWFIWVLFCLLNQGWLPLNPDQNPSQTPDQAFNTAISFLVNCNLQHYSGETGVSYFTQTFALQFLHFVSASTGIAAAIVVFNSMKPGIHRTLGNFYNYFVKSMTRVLVPLAIVVALIHLFLGQPMTFHGKEQFITLQGDTQYVSTGPVASMIPIKHLGTNGGGFFGANSAHPLENPNYLTDFVQIISQVIIPLGMIFALGFYLKRRRLSWMIYGVMTLGFLMLLIPTLSSEIAGNPLIAKMGIAPGGNMEGKEVRIGVPGSAYWSIATTVISTGSVNAMHDSFMPLSGMNMMLGMMVNCFYGGCGVGFLNFYVFIILAVFISGLMVGRTPEFMGKKVEAKEMKIAMIVALLHPFLILAGTAIASYLAAHDTSMGWWALDASGKSLHASGLLDNPSYHGFSEMLYEFTSSAANNGSGFEGLGDNNPFWNITTGIVLLLSRYLPIIGPVAIAGILAQKKYIPESAGTLQTDTATFGFVVFAVIAIVAALSFFPALALGPIAEWLSI